MIADVFFFTASSWNGSNRDSGTCSVHSFNEAPEDEAEPKMGRQVDDKLRPTNPATGFSRSSVLGLLWENE